MPNNGRGGNLNGVAVVLLVMAVISMLFFAFWLQKSGTRGRRPGATTGAPSGSSGVTTEDETAASDLDALIRERKSAIGQIRPGSVDFMPANDIPPRPISRDFHKLPDAYFLPQAPDETRRATERIRELREPGPQPGMARDSGSMGGNR
ncbi:hypothetical protein KBA41_12850 [Candidatus Ozemobacteraceae bacterium]|nr:hypothetical protein [Candidatus Ozemobacteraceae bacterium]